MSVYVVNVHESPAPGQQQGHQGLRDLARRFNGSIFHQDSNYGSFMVHEEPDMTREAQIEGIRHYFQSQALNVREFANADGHVIFEVDLTSSLQDRPATLTF
jgi:hypothetical protein